MISREKGRFGVGVEGFLSIIETGEYLKRRSKEFPKRIFWKKMKRMQVVNQISPKPRSLTYYTSRSIPDLPSSPPPPTPLQGSKSVRFPYLWPSLYCRSRTSRMSVFSNAVFCLFPLSLAGRFFFCPFPACVLTTFFPPWWIERSLSKN